MTRLLLACVALSMLAAPAQSVASPDQRSILQDDARLINSTASVRDASLDELVALGVDTVKFTIDWRSFAPAGRQRPAGFQAADPAAYPAERWAPYDDAIAGAQRRGIEPFLQVTGPAPDWAAPGRSDPPGISRPDPEEFGSFVRAVGTRYSGSYSGLPGVGLWSIWNEPNLPRFLLPQRSSTRARTPVAPHLYRRLYLAAHAALTASGHGQQTILMGELLPVGRPPTSSRASMRPLEFLRELACVDRRGRPYRGPAARARECTGYEPLPGTGVAHHPYTQSGGPGVRPPHPDDVPIGSIARLIRTLDLLGRRGRLRRGMPVFLTEFGFQTDPPDPIQTPIRRVPGYLGESEAIALASPRIGSVSQYPLVDDELKGEGLARFGGFQSGLRFADGRPKPGVYGAYQRPLHVRGRTPSTVELLGGVRTGDAGDTVRIETRLGRGRFRPVGGAVRLSARGYFRRVVRVRNAARRQFRFRAGGEVSRAARPSSR